MANADESAGEDGEVAYSALKSNTLTPFDNEPRKWKTTSEAEGPYLRDVDPPSLACE